MNINIYWERQVGGNCRIHSLNSFFGLKKYSEFEFNKYCKKYDNINLSLYNTIISCKQFDLVNSNQQNIISYILKQNNIYTKYYPINFIYINEINDIISNSLKRFFIYNANHIWVIKKYNNDWYEVDSLRGINKINTDIINFIKNCKNAGFIIPINSINYFYKNLIKINNIIFEGSSFKKHEKLKYITEFLIRNNKEKKILGEIEVPLNVCIDILKFILDRKSFNKQNTTFMPIKNIIDKYNIFLKKFTNRNYNDINLILIYLPDIINNLINLEN